MSYLLGILRIVPLLILTPGLCLRCSGQLYESNLRLLAGECVSNAIVFQSLGDGTPVKVSWNITNGTGPALLQICDTSNSCSSVKTGDSFDQAGQILFDGTAYPLLGAGTYLLTVCNLGPDVNECTVAVTILGKPFIVRQPTSRVSCITGTADFSVRAAGKQPLAYQWLFNGSALSGQVNTNLGLGALQSSNAGPYSVVVSNDLGMATSSVANLFLNDACVGIHMFAGLNISGESGRTYVLKFTTDLSNTNFAGWTTLATNTMTSSGWFFLDTNSPYAPMRFYGVKLLP